MQRLNDEVGWPESKIWLSKFNSFQLGCWKSFHVGHPSIPPACPLPNLRRSRPIPFVSERLQMMTDDDDDDDDDDVVEEKSSTEINQNLNSLQPSHLPSTCIKMFMCRVGSKQRSRWDCHRPRIYNSSGSTATHCLASDLEQVKLAQASMASGLLTGLSLVAFGIGRCVTATTQMLPWF